ncbi:hypothetical protein V8C34DRAFT_282886 [Trichoderma compactum]
MYSVLGWHFGLLPIILSFYARAPMPQSTLVAGLGFSEALCMYLVLCPTPGTLGRDEG